jgi:hypothetical protein
MLGKVMQQTKKNIKNGVEKEVDIKKNLSQIHTKKLKNERIAGNSWEAPWCQGDYNSTR